MDDHSDLEGPLAILLVKHPRQGEVKTRLARLYGEELAAELYRNFVLDMLASLEVTRLRYAVSYFPPESLSSVMAWLGGSLSYEAQRGRDHPERLKNAFIDAFSRGEERVFVLASDVPDLSPAIILEASSCLEQSDAVLGPSLDGGYYLIGFRRDAFREKAFQDIAWSTPQAFSDTLSRLGGLHVHVLPVWPDIDTPSDLVELIGSRRNPTFSSSRTMAILRDNKLVGP